MEVYTSAISGTQCTLYNYLHPLLKFTSNRSLVVSLCIFTGRHGRVVRPSVRPSVCPSHASTESKQCKLGSRNLHRRIAQGL